MCIGAVRGQLVRPRAPLSLFHITYLIVCKRLMCLQVALYRYSSNTSVSYLISIKEQLRKIQIPVFSLNVFAINYGLKRSKK
jgi:hypothetical protein